MTECCGIRFEESQTICQKCGKEALQELIALEGLYSQGLIDEFEFNTKKEELNIYECLMDGGRFK